MGFTIEEKQRHDRFVLGERDNLIPVLIDAGLTKQNCFERLQKAGIALPEMYKLGYPNANCIGCVKAASPTYWNHVRRTHPAVFEARKELFRQFKARVVNIKGQFHYLDDLDPDLQGRPMKTLKMPDCGIFCEEGLTKDPEDAC